MVYPLLGEVVLNCSKMKTAKFQKATMGRQNIDTQSLNCREKLKQDSAFVIVLCTVILHSEVTTTCFGLVHVG